MTDAPAKPRRAGCAGIAVPIGLFLVALAAWTGWWFYLANQVETRLDAQLDTLRQDGWTITHARRDVSGWPFRVRVGHSDVTVAAPSGQGATLPSLVAEATAYRPDLWVLIAPQGLTLKRPGKGDVAVAARAIRADLTGLTQRWPHLNIELTQPTFTPAAGAQPFPIASAELVGFSMRPHQAATDAPGAPAPAPVQAAPGSVDVLFRLIEARGRPEGPVQGVTNDGRLTVQVEAVVERPELLGDPSRAGVFASWTAAGGRLSRVAGEIRAGESAAVIRSDALSVGPDGRLVGELHLKAERPAAAITGLARSNSGSVDRLGAAGAAAATAVTGDVDLTIVFRDGRTWLGPFPLAPAPKLF